MTVASPVSTQSSSPSAADHPRPDLAEPPRSTSPKVTAATIRWQRWR
jgi:hypothetical protein